MVVYWIHLPNVGIEKNGYVGISTNVKQRWAKHKSLVSGSHHLKNAIQKYGTALVWEVIFEGSEEDCIALEEIYRPIPDIGWNIKSGGSYCKLSIISRNKIKEKLTGNTNAAGHTMSLDVIEKLRQINLNNSYRLGSTLSQETRNKISLKKSGKLLSITHREKIKAAMVGKTLSEETRVKISVAQKGTLLGKDNPKSKNIICLETGIVYAAILEASRELGITSSNISSCCRGITKTAGGYHWSYYKEEMNENK